MLPIRHPCVRWAGRLQRGLQWWRGRTPTDQFGPSLRRFGTTMPSA